MSTMSRRSVLSTGAAALAVTLAGCARGTGMARSGDGATVAPQAPGDLDPAVLDGWRDFPVSRVPRPILLIDPPPRETGYRTGDAKLAVSMGRYDLAAPLPSGGPATVEVHLPEGTFGLPVITAQQAYDRMRATGNAANFPGTEPVPLRITQVELGTAPFRTDRGEFTLPAWLFHAPDSFDPLAWPALHPDAFWRLGDLPPAGSTSDGHLAADGVTLTVTMPAPYPGACPGDPIYTYDPVLAESGTTVVVGVRPRVVSTAPGSHRDDCGYDAMLRLQPYQIRLAAPLGNRVLVSQSGGPVPVLIGG